MANALYGTAFSVHGRLPPASRAGGGCRGDAAAAPVLSVAVVPADWTSAAAAAAAAAIAAVADVVPADAGANAPLPSLRVCRLRSALSFKKKPARGNGMRMEDRVPAT